MYATKLQAAYKKQLWTWIITTEATLMKGVTLQDYKIVSSVSQVTNI